MNALRNFGKSKLARAKQSVSKMKKKIGGSSPIYETSPLAWEICVALS